MKPITTAFLLLSGLFMFSGEADPSLLFKANFDNVTVTAGHAAGEKKAYGFPESLALRMYAGPGGKGNALTLNTKEALTYSNYKNFDPRKGTISFWVASMNWKPSEKKFQVFFRSDVPGGYNLLVYKFINQSLLRFAITIKRKEVGYINVPLKNEDWAPGRWHKIDAVWDENQMALYLDGVLAKPLPYTKNPLKFRQKMTFPETMPKGTMALGQNKHFIHDAKHFSAYDELEIYNRMLSPVEIRRNYEKFVPPAARLQRNELEVPLGRPVTLDGKLDAAEWQDAACTLVINPDGTSKAGSRGKVYLKHSGKELLIGAEIEGGERHLIKGNDLVDIWRDDSFELHVFTPQKKRYQFIINSAGALFDAKIDRDDGVYDLTRLNPKWNSGARTAAQRQNGKWTLEMAIPRSSIGADGKSVMVNLCATRYLDKAFHASWGMNCKHYFDEQRFGILHFTGKKKPVRLEKLGLRDGSFEMQLNPEIPAWLLASDRTKSPRPAGKALWQVELPAGIYDFTAKAKQFYYASRIAINQPLEIKYTCYASKKRLDVTLDADGAAEDSEIRPRRSNGFAGVPRWEKDPLGKNRHEKYHCQPFPAVPGSSPARHVFLESGRSGQRQTGDHRESAVPGSRYDALQGKNSGESHRSGTVDSGQTAGFPPFSGVEPRLYVRKRSFPGPDRGRRRKNAGIRAGPAAGRRSGQMGFFQTDEEI